MVGDGYGRVCISSEGGNSIIFIQDTLPFASQDDFHRRIVRGFGDLSIL
jgi:hypothetical protein